jgi:hypothetical protein
MPEPASDFDESIEGRPAPPVCVTGLILMQLGAAWGAGGHCRQRLRRRDLLALPTLGEGPMSALRSVVAVLIAAACLTECTIQRAVIANDAQNKMVGLSKEQVLACMGAPRKGATEVWTYDSGFSGSSGRGWAVLHRQCHDDQRTCERGQLSGSNRRPVVT